MRPPGLRFAFLLPLALALFACGGDDSPPPVASGILALDGNQVVAVDVDARTVEPVGQPIPSGLMSPRLLASLDNSRVALTGNTGPGMNALYVMRFGSWEEVVTDATRVFTTVDLRFHGYGRDLMSADPGTRAFSAEGTMIFEDADPNARISSSLDGVRAFVRDGTELRIFSADGTESSFDPMLLTDWRPRLATGGRVLLGPSDLGSWYSFDGVMGETVTSESAGVGYLLEADGRLTYALENEDIEVATMLPPDATRALTSDSSQILIDDRDALRVFSPDGTQLALITPELHTGELPPGAPAPASVRMGDVAASIPNAGVFVTNQNAADGSPSLTTIVRFTVDGSGATQELLAALPFIDAGDPLGDRPDSRVVTWANRTAVHFVDPLSGETGSFEGFTGTVAWARYPGAQGHRLPGD